MKIGILSDIHGHIEALIKALMLLEHHRVDYIICAGDLVDRGYHSEKVVKLIKDRKIPCVQGNHDALAGYTREFLEQHPEIVTSMNGLSPDSMHYLNELSHSLQFEWMEIALYLTHANTWEDMQTYVYPNSPPWIFQRLLREAQSEIIVLGHTHEPMWLHFKGTFIINPGSVYENRTVRGSRTCGILSLPSCKFDLYNIDSGLSQNIKLTQLSG